MLSEKWLTDVVYWCTKLDEIGKEHGLNPALREFFLERAARFEPLEDAACLALQACEITKPIAER